MEIPFFMYFKNMQSLKSLSSDILILNFGISNLKIKESVGIFINNIYENHFVMKFCYKRVLFVIFSAQHKFTGSNSPKNRDFFSNTGNCLIKSYARLHALGLWNCLAASVLLYSGFYRSMRTSHSYSSFSILWFKIEFLNWSDYLLFFSFYIFLTFLLSFLICFIY